MELDRRVRVEVNRSHVRSGTGEKLTSINLYKDVPFGSLTLDECQDLFRQRLEALQIMEKTDFMRTDSIGSVSKSFRDIKSCSYKTNCILLRANDKEQAKQDHLSHMITRMFCVYQPDLWSWFRTNERKLFQYRLKDQAATLSGAQLEGILQNFEFNFRRVIGSEQNDLIRNEIIGYDRMKASDSVSSDIFEVDIFDALKFLSRRSIPLRDGYAYLTRHQIMIVVSDVYADHLDKELKYARQHLNTQLPQARVLLESLETVYTEFQEKIKDQNKKAKLLENGESKNPYKLDIDNIDEVSTVHFPPCMRHMHESLRKDHHMKHFGRLYYGTFLRSCGVELEDSINFWRNEFTKNIAADKFDREYKYNIRHIYGKEGHNKALTSFSCDKIINDNAPGPSETHGCPFRHFDETHLKTLLTKHDLKDADIETVLNHVRTKDFKMACSHYFSFKRGELPPEPIKNPAQYYYESMRILNRPVKTEEDMEEEMQQQTKMDTSASSKVPIKTEVKEKNDEDMFDDDFEL